MRRVSMLGVSFDEKFVDWLIENVSPLENPDNRLRGLTWSIYWYHTPNISGFGLNLFPTMEISFDNDDDATLFALSFPCNL